jgi:ribosomal protein S12 methylthiotransferase accessory factor
VRRRGEGVEALSRASEEAYQDLGGTIRARNAAETLRWLKSKFARCGLTRIARVTGLDHVGVSVSMAIRPLSRTLSVSQGKGTTAELADVSAAMESIELWHAENAPAAEISGSHAELSRQGHPVVDPRRLGPRGVFPEAFDLCARVCGWLRGTSMVTGRECLVPRYLVIGTDLALLEHLSINVNSTGLAGGNTLEEATCHALCEVIERDATARFEALAADEQDQREVDLTTVTGPAREVLSKLAAAGLRTRLWDQTSHVGVPAFSCTVEGVAELRGLGRAVGYGAHLDPEIAVSRAASEAVQSRLTIISGARDDRPPATYDSMQLYSSASPEVSPPRRPFARAPERQTTGGFASDARLLVDKVGRAGFSEVLRVNLTQPDFGVPVVLVFVPSMLMVAD